MSIKEVVGAGCTGDCGLDGAKGIMGQRRWNMELSF